MLTFLLAVAIEFLALRWLLRRIGNRTVVMLLLAVPVGVLAGLLAGVAVPVALGLDGAQIIGTAIRSATTQAFVAIIVLFGVRWLDSPPAQ